MRLKIGKRLKIEKGVRMAYLQFRGKRDKLRKLNRKRKEENNSEYILEEKLTGPGE